MDGQDRVEGDDLADLANDVPLGDPDPAHLFAILQVAASTAAVGRLDLSKATAAAAAAGAARKGSNVQSPKSKADERNDEIRMTNVGKEVLSSFVIRISSF